MQAKLLDKQGNTGEKLSLNKDLFGLKDNSTVLNQYIRIYKQNQRQGTQSTKTRGEVQGSAAKPWAQKGTGRARAGEKRNPIWRHGGIAHGPKPRDWSLMLSNSLRNTALKSALSLKAKKEKLYVCEDFNFEAISTKQAVAFSNSKELKGKTLVILGEKKPNVVKSFANLKNVVTCLVDNLNTYALLVNSNVVFEKSALEKLERKFKK